jgi:hypothetical protein
MNSKQAVQKFVAGHPETGVPLSKIRAVCLYCYEAFDCKY